MIYLSGAIHPDYAMRCQTGHGIGFLCTRTVGNVLPDGATWAADNGCFRHPEAFRLEEYLVWLDRLPRAGCLFVTAPDWVGDWDATLERFFATAPAIRDAGWPVALVAQNGIEHYLDQLDYRTFDWLFLGGSLPWKLSAAAREVVEAVRPHRPVHMGCVNTLDRLRYAARLGCSSVDGTYLAHAGHGHLHVVQSWIEELDRMDAGARVQSAIDFGSYA